MLLTLVASVYDIATVDPTATVPRLGPHDHAIRTGDVTTRYQAWGQRGPVLVLIPGFIEASSVFDRVGPRLGKRFRVYALDVRGFGYTTHRPPYTLDADTAQVVSFLHALHLDGAHASRPIVIGHSSGAAIAVNLALSFPSLVSGILMLDGDGTSSGAGPAWEHDLIVDPFYTAIRRLVLTHPSLMRRVWQRVCGPACPPFRGAEEESWTRPLEVPGAKAALKAIVQAPLIGVPKARQKHVHVPSAVMLGSQDPTITLARARSQAHWLHSKILVVVPRARHLPMISDPHDFVRDVTRIVARLRAAPS